MNVAWRKLGGDLRAHRWQWLAMVAAIVLGGAGMIGAQGARAILEREIPDNFERSHPADLTFWFETATPAALELVRRAPGVAAAELRGGFTTRIETAPGKWLPLRVSMAIDPMALAVGSVFADGRSVATLSMPALFIERSGRPMLNGQPGEPINARSVSGEDATLTLAGYVFDPSVAPSTQEQTLYGYGTLAAARALHPAARFDQVTVAMQTPGSERDAAELGADIRAALTAASLAPLRVDSRRATHPHDALMTAMLRALAVFGWMAAALAAALTSYFALAWMRRETTQVAVMKTLGARRRHIFPLYLACAAGVLAASLAMALPLGNALGLAMADFQAGYTNITIHIRTAPIAVALRAAAFFAALVMASMLLPVLLACRRPVIDALRGPSIAAPSLAIRGALRLPSGALAVGSRLALRNVWRRPWRAAMVVLAFACGGALMLTTRTNFDSYVAAIDNNQARRGHDIEVLFAKPHDIAALQRAAAATPVTAAAEVWQRARVKLAGGSATLAAFPDDTRMFTAPLAQGRYIGPDSGSEIVVTRFLADRFPLLKAGTSVELGFGEARLPVTVVGIVEEIAAPVAYTNARTFAAVTGPQPKGASLRVRLVPTDATGAANELDRALMRAGMVPAQIISAGMVRDSLIEHFLVVGDAMRLTAFAVALLGAITLCAMAIFNTLDRSRELAILRAIGAPPGAVIRLMLIEAGSVLGAGLIAAVALSLVISRALLDAGERMLLHIAVPMQFSWLGLAQLVTGAILTFAVIALVIALQSRATASAGLAYE